MTHSGLTTELIRAAADRDRGEFCARIAEESLAAAVDVWLKRIARRKATPLQRARLIRAVIRGSAAETKDVQLTHAALLRAAGLDERAAATAAVAAGATYTELGAVLGISQQGASFRVRSYVEDRSGAVDVGVGLGKR